MRNQIEVWIVSRGELCEGGRILRVCATREAALAIVPTIECHWPGGWIASPTVADWWENGDCDYLTIDFYEVQS